MISRGLLEAMKTTMSRERRENLASSHPAWAPTPEFIATTNIAWLMKPGGRRLVPCAARMVGAKPRGVLGTGDRAARHPLRAAVQPGARFGKTAWSRRAGLWMRDSTSWRVAFAGPPESPAIVHQAEGADLKTTSVGELAALDQARGGESRTAGISNRAMPWRWSCR